MPELSSWLGDTQMNGEPSPAEMHMEECMRCKIFEYSSLCYSVSTAALVPVWLWWYKEKHYGICWVCCSCFQNHGKVSKSAG